MHTILYEKSIKTQGIDIHKSVYREREKPAKNIMNTLKPVFLQTVIL